MRDPSMGTGRPLGQLDPTAIPRYAGFATFARLPRIDDVVAAQVAVLGVPFDATVTYRPVARFGPSHVRESSRHVSAHNMTAAEEAEDVDAAFEVLARVLGGVRSAGVARPTGTAPPQQLYWRPKACSTTPR
jgi:hypothetical protein